MDGYQLPAARSAPVNIASVLTTLALFFGVLYIALFKWKRRRLEKLASLLPGPPALPIIGNGLEFLGDPQDVMSKILAICSRYESPFRVWIGPLLLICVSKPDDLQIVLNSSKTLEKDPLYRFFRNTVGTGLFSAPVEKWKRNRRAIAPAFNNRLLEQFIPVFNQQNRMLVSKLARVAGRGQFDVWDFVSPATLDIICHLKAPSLDLLKNGLIVMYGLSQAQDPFYLKHEYHILKKETALGVDVKAQDDPESDFALALPRASELDYMRIFKFWLHPDFIFNRVSYAAELRQVYKQLHGLPNAVIRQKKEEFRKRKEQALNAENEGATEENKDKKKLKVFVDILLELKDQGNTFTDDDLRDEVVTMMVGGSETSALTNCYCLLMLAMHEDVQNKVYDEIHSIFGDSDRDVITEDLNNMVYLEMVLKETLRKFPVGPVFLRKVSEDIELTDYALPAGCSVVIAPISTHMNPSLYPDPQKFDPERFSPDNVAQRHRYSFIPFSGGPRGCIGSKYAMMSMKITISTVLRSYKLFTTVKMEDIKLKVDLLMRSVDGFKLRLEPRRSS